ncbi:hypothetical protein GBA52_002715 [Prunus armeniaca]|nr:hypothetical protein GBA52_002715 [Prunus armeniaca]
MLHFVWHPPPPPNSKDKIITPYHCRLLCLPAPLSISLKSQNTQIPVYSLQFFLLHLFFIKETQRAFLICSLKLEMKTMANGLNLIFLLGFLLLLSRAEARSMPAASILPESDPNASSPNIPIRSSPIEEEPSLDVDDDDACKGLNSEECLIRRSMVAHTDYIYTQDISSTGP